MGGVAGFFADGVGALPGAKVGLVMGATYGTFDALGQAAGVMLCTLEADQSWGMDSHVLDQETQDRGMEQYIKDNFPEADPHIYHGVDDNRGDVSDEA